MPEPDRSQHQKYIDKYLQSNQSHVIGVDREIKGMRKDGSIFPMRLGLSEISTSKGVFFTGIIRDLSQQKLAEERLHLAKISAEEANYAKSEFLASMSHELRTPMNAIIGFAQLMMGSHANPVNDTQKEQLQQIIYSGNHLMELINQVLELNKIETGHLDVTIMEANVYDIVDECIDNLAPRSKETNITLQNRIGDGLPEVLYTDITRLRQILYNLISNAIKYNRPSGYVFIDSRMTENDKVRISVHDTGLGIPLDLQDNVFIPFNRLGRESGDIDGTGIGLTITQKLVEAIKGEIGFSSTEGEGSIFWIDLPLITPYDK